MSNFRDAISANKQMFSLLLNENPPLVIRDMDPLLARDLLAAAMGVVAGALNSHAVRLNISFEEVVLRAIDSGDEIDEEAVERMRRQRGL